MKPKLIQRVAKLVPYPAKNSTVPALAFAYHFEPTPEQNLELGSLFVAIEVMAREALASQVVDLVIKTIGEHYYNQKFNDEVPVRFEKTVDLLNKQLAELLTSHHGKSIGHIHAVFAILNGENLYLTKTGKAHALLYRGTKTTEISAGLEDGSTIQKSFRNIAEGQLRSGDKLLFATPALLFQFSEKELANLVTDNTPSTCVNKLSASLGTDETASRCGAVIVELADLEKAMAEPLENQIGDATIGKPRTRIDDMKLAATPTARRLANASTQKAKQAGSWVRHSLLVKTKERGKTSWRKLWSDYINPNPKRAIVIGVLGITVLTLLLVGTFSGRTDYKALTIQYKELTALTDTAEAKISTGDKKASQSALSSAQTKLADIQKQYTQKQISEAIAADKDLGPQDNISPAKLAMRFVTINDSLASITRLDSTNVVDLSTNKSFTSSPLSQMGDRLYVVNTATGGLIQINPASKSSVSLGQQSALRNTVGMTASADGSVLYILTKSSGVYSYKLGGGISAVALSAGEWSTGQAIATYIGNLYILSSENNQIYRHSKTSIGFSASSSYLKKTNTIDVKAGVSLTINGSIIMSNGTTKLSIFTNGIGQTQAIRNLPERVSGIAQLQIAPDGTSLYGLTKDKRAIVKLTLSDDGSIAFENQYAKTDNGIIDSFVYNSGIFYAQAGAKITKLAIR